MSSIASSSSTKRVALFSNICVFSESLSAFKSSVSFTLPKASVSDGPEMVLNPNFNDAPMTKTGVSEVSDSVFCPGDGGGGGAADSLAG